MTGMSRYDPWFATNTTASSLGGSSSDPSTLGLMPMFQSDSRPHSRATNVGGRIRRQSKSGDARAAAKHKGNIRRAVSHACVAKNSPYLRVVVGKTRRG